MGAGVGTDFEAGVDPGLELSLIHQGLSAPQLFGIPGVVRSDTFADDEASGTESILREHRRGVHDVVCIAVVESERDTSRSVARAEPANSFRKRHAGQPDAPQPPEMALELLRRHVK